VFPLPLLVITLALVAVYRHARWPAILAIVLAAWPCLVLWNEVASQQPSDDWEVEDAQKFERDVAVWYSCLVAVAVVSLICVIGGRWRNGSAPESVPKGSGFRDVCPSCGVDRSVTRGVYCELCQRYPKAVG
jgi:hypothetical protein